MHDMAIPSDPSKPLPGDVLKTFSLGLEFKNKLFELQSEAENSMLSPSEKDLKCVQIMESSADERNFLGLGRDSPKYLDGKHSDCSKEREIIHALSLDSPHASKSEDYGSVPRKEIDAGAKISLDASQKIEILDTKVNPSLFCISFILNIRVFHYALMFILPRYVTFQGVSYTKYIFFHIPYL